MALTLAEADIGEVRLQIGTEVDASKLSDAQIQSDSVLGEASDYVLGKVLPNVDVNKLDSSQKTIVDNLLDGSSDDIDQFVSDVLVGRQQAIFKRAVIYRTAGNCIFSVPIVSSENASRSGVMQERVVPQKEELRNALYQHCDNQIQLLQDLFPEDAITRPQITLVTHNIVIKDNYGCFAFSTQFYHTDGFWLYAYPWRCSCFTRKALCGRFVKWQFPERKDICL